MSAGYPWWLEPASWLGAMIVRLLGPTWRVERRGMVDFDARIASGERCIFACWHARLLPFAFTHRGQGIAVLVSHHRDGQIIARIIERMGFVTGRGSSTRGGEEGLRDMMEWAERRHLLGIAPDGPRGPAEKMKPGLLYLASRTRFPIVPLASASSSAWRLRSWDGFRIPRPFARVVVAYGAPIEVGRDLDREALERLHGEVESAIARLTLETDQRAGVAV